MKESIIIKKHTHVIKHILQTEGSRCEEEFEVQKEKSLKKERILLEDKSVSLFPDIPFRLRGRRMPSHWTFVSSLCYMSYVSLQGCVHIPGQALKPGIYLVSKTRSWLSYSFSILESLTCVFMLLFILIPCIFSIHSLFLSQSRFGKHPLLAIFFVFFFVFSVQRRWVAEKSGDKSKSKQLWSYTRNYTGEQNWRRKGEGRRCNIICRERQKILPLFLSWL